MKEASAAPKKKPSRLDRKLLKRIGTYFFPYKWHIFLAIIASGLVSLSTAGTAWLIKPAMDDIFIRKDLRALAIVPLIYIGLMLLKGVGRYTQSLCMTYSALCVLKNLRGQLFAKIAGLPLAFYEKTQVGVLMSRIINDVNMISSSLTAFVQMFRQILTVAGLIGVVFYQNFELACWAMVVLPIAAAPVVTFSRALRRYGRRGAEVNAEFSATLQELFSGIRVIKAFATEQRETRRFDQGNQKLVDIAFRRTKVGELSSPVMELIAAVGIGVILWYGGTKVIDGAMTPGTFFSFIAALIMLYDPFKSFNSANMDVQNALAGAERVFAMLDDPTLIVEAGGTTEFDEPFRELVFDHVSLTYDQADAQGPDAESAAALSDICLTVKAGQKIAFVGPSGAGKTSLVSLIPRFYDPSAGRILINGRPVTDYTLASLRRSIALVAQEPFLFDMTLKENIAYGRSETLPDDPEALLEDVKKAAHAAHADTFIESLPEGYETVMGERGVKLSGGQRQRITIARAILKDAPLLILDEATSALDSEAERIVQRALNNLMEGRTSLIIAHRLSTILGADAIVVMERGRIVDIGRHEDLLKRCELYNRLYKMQFQGNA